LDAASSTHFHLVGVHVAAHDQSGMGAAWTTRACKSSKLGQMTHARRGKPSRPAWIRLQKISKLIVAGKHLPPRAGVTYQSVMVDGPCILNVVLDQIRQSDGPIEESCTGRGIDRSSCALDRKQREVLLQQLEPRGAGSAT